jgi:hypothetical protein
MANNVLRKEVAFANHDLSGPAIGPRPELHFPRTLFWRMDPGLHRCGSLALRNLGIEAAIAAGVAVLRGWLQVGLKLGQWAAQLGTDGEQAKPSVPCAGH